MAIIIETCPECGHDLIDEMIYTNPPIPRKFCPNCGWCWEGKRDEIFKIRFSEDKTMDNKDIISKIKEKAYENVNRKLEEERKKTENKINNELADVEKCLSYINNRLIYKVITTKNYRATNYVLADEEMFFNDYNKETNWYKGIYFPSDEKYLFRVNGEEYYDVRYLMQDYTKEFEEYRKDLERLNKIFRELEEGYKKLIAQEENVKSMLEQLKKVEAD